MAIKLTVESFLKLVQQSGLIEEGHLKLLLATASDQGRKLKTSRDVADALIAAKALSEWQAKKLLQGKRGFFLGKYRLNSLLGKGGMSSVYLAEHVLMRRRCAIKVLPAKRVDETSYLERFHREAQAVASLDHPNIVRAYDVDFQQEKDVQIHFLVMEYVQGESLQELVTANGPCSYCDAADFIRQAAEGLSHAHGAGLVHRDIKPGNLLVDSTGVVKILDLGLARFFHQGDEESVTLRHDEKVLGTADYLAPEQALDSHNVDHRADIYSLGCTAYYLLTGHPPFLEGTLAQRLMCHQNRQPPAISIDRPDVPPLFTEVVSRMMAKKPDDRYQEASHIAEVLEAWLQEHADENWKTRNPRLANSSTVSNLISYTDDPPPAGDLDDHSIVEIDDTAAPSGTPTAIASDTNDVGLTAFLANLDTWAADSQDPESLESAPFGSSGANTPAESGLEFGEAPPFDVVANPQPIDPIVSESAADHLANLAANSSLTGMMRGLTAKDGQPVSQHDDADASGDSGRLPNALPAAPEENMEFAPFPEFSAAPAGTRHRKTSARPQRLVVKNLWSNHRNATLAAGMFVLAMVITAAWSVFSTLDVESSPGTPPDSSVNETQGSSGDASPDGISLLPITDNTLHIGPQGDVLTIEEAVKYVRQHRDQFRLRGRRARINLQLQGGVTYAERLVLDNSDGKGLLDALRITVTGDEPATLAPSGSEPVVVLNSPQNLSIERLRIETDGKPVAIEVSGICGDLRFEHSAINGFSQTGIALLGCRGLNQAEIQFNDIRLTPGAETAIGIRMSPGEESAGPSRLVIQNCRVLGPIDAGILVESDVRFVAIRQNIFANGENGIEFDKSAMACRDVMIANNTFYQLKRGIVFEQMPGDATAQFGFYRNLFASVDGPELVIQNGYNEQKFHHMLSTNGAAVEHNWTNRQSPADAALGEHNLIIRPAVQRVDDFEFASTTTTDPGFLAPTSTSPHRYVAQPRFNLPSQIGAVPTLAFGDSPAGNSQE